MKTKYFCHEIEHNLAIWAYNDKVFYTPCSFNKNLIYGSTNKIVNTKKIWNKQKHIEIKNTVNDNLPVPGCHTCYNSETKGHESRRIAVKSLYENFLNFDEENEEKFISIDFSVGNLCNLKCLICGPENSTAWFSDYQKLFPHISIEKYKFNKEQQITIDESIIQGNIKRIHFHGGGEPLLSTSHVDLLKLLKKQNKLSDLYVFYNTNGTIKVSNEILDLWSECKLVELYFSIDDIGSRLEYQRPGISWDKLQDNLLWFKDNMPVNHMFKINCVYSYLNFYYLDELYRWYEKYFKQNRLGDETIFLFQQVIANNQYNLKLQRLTQEQYNFLQTKFKNNKILINLLQNIQISNQENHNDFLKIITKFDSIREKKYTEAHQEWINLLLGKQHV
jgi:hypothetical protein